MAYKIIGNTVAEWEDSEPLIFTLSAMTGSNDDRRLTTYQCDLSTLRDGFEEPFLLDLKDLIMERRHRTSLITVRTEYENVSCLFRKVIKKALFKTKRSVVDETFLLAISTIINEVSKVCLDTLRRFFNFNPHSPVFAMGLSSEDFPVKSDKKGVYGTIVDSILGKVLARSASVEILSRCEEAYEDGKLDIGLFSFINLAFSVYVRPDSYRRIRLIDLVADTVADTFLIYIPPAKDRVHKSDKIPYRVNKHVGVLLLKQRQYVIDRFGHLVENDSISKLPLFPARGVKKNNTGWLSEYSNMFLGEIENGSIFSNAYFREIQLKVLNGKRGLNGNSLRHTIGTQLAEMGCSAKTIQAILKHAGEQTCMAYVDIAFHGLINELSDAMQPAFEEHLPVFRRFRSRDGLVAPDKAVYSEEIESGRTELVGECGRQIRCQAAPFTCYECSRFIPCFDADHTLNLIMIQADIEKYKNCGTPYKHLVEKAKTIKYRIHLVIMACDRYLQTVAEQKGCA